MERERREGEGEGRGIFGCKRLTVSDIYLGRFEPRRTDGEKRASEQRTGRVWDWSERSVQCERDCGQTRAGMSSVRDERSGYSGDDRIDRLRH